MLEIVVSALEPPRSAVGMAQRVHLAEWTGPGTASVRPELSAILGKGAIGEPLQAAVEAWPPAEAVRVVRASERPEVVIRGAVVLGEESLATDDEKCSTRTVLVSVFAEAQRVVGDPVTDRLRWNMALRDRVCGGAAPRSGPELVEALLRGIAPEIAGLVVPRWTASEMALASSPVACNRGNDWVESDDWDVAARVWGAQRAEPACPYNLGVKAELEGDIDLALGLYAMAQERGVDTTKAVARARKRAADLDALGWGVDELRRIDRAPPPSGLPIPSPPPPPPPPVWVPEQRFTLALDYARHPSLGYRRERLVPSVAPRLGDLVSGARMEPVEWHSEDGIDRGFSASFAYAGDTLALAGGVAAFPGGAPMDEVSEWLIDNGHRTRVVKVRGAAWAGLTPITLTGQTATSQAYVRAALSVGVGGVMAQPYGLRGSSWDPIVNANWNPQYLVTPVLSGTLEMGLQSRLSLHVERTYLLLVVQPTVPINSVVVVRTLGLSYRF